MANRGDDSNGNNTDIESAYKLYMPTNPTWEVIDVLPDTAFALQSKAKVPFVVDFLVRKYDVNVATIVKHEIEEQNRSVSKANGNNNSNNSNNGNDEFNDQVMTSTSIPPTPVQSNPPPIERQKCIFKTHDDCRQDELALQVMALLKQIWQESGLELYVLPYKVIATRSSNDRVIGGMIECVPNARSRSDIGHDTNWELRRYFKEI